MSMTAEDKFKKATGETDDSKVSLFLSFAESKILEVTNRSAMPETLIQSQIDLAIALYNRNGEEGESSHSEGGVNHTYLSPDDILKTAMNYRLSPSARRISDAKKKNEEISS